MVSLDSLVQWFDRIKSQWWALPTLLPCLLLPYIVNLNAHTLLDDGQVYLLYLPLAFMTALVLIYGWKTFPGMILAILLRYIPLRGELVAFLTVLHFFFPLMISWIGYQIFAPRRHSGGNIVLKLFVARYCWLVLVNATLFLLFYEMGLLLGLYDKYSLTVSERFWSVSTLINYQGILVGGIIGLPFFYHMLRIIIKPRYIKSYTSRMMSQRQAGVSCIELLMWGLIVITLLVLLLSPIGEGSTIFSTDYSLMLLLPVMLWGAARYGILFISMVWVLLLIILSSQFEKFITPEMGMELHLAIVSSYYVGATLATILVAAIAGRQRHSHYKNDKMIYTDPVANLPNLRALRRDLQQDTRWMIAVVSIPELELLGHNYGILLRIHYKQQLAAYLKTILADDESVYHVSGYHLILLLNTTSYESRMQTLYKRVKLFRFSWHGMPVQPHFGISYSLVNHPVTQLYAELGQLIALTSRSLATSHPEFLKHKESQHVLKRIKYKVDMINNLQSALDNDRFVLMAQPIQGARGDIYYEIMLRMEDENKQLVLPEAFLPTAQEFGFSTRIDRWVLHNALSFMNIHRQELPGIRFSINLTPASLSRYFFAKKIKRLLAIYNIEPWQIMFEVGHLGPALSLQQANITLTELRELGCQIAIDNFGRGYDCYAWLKELDADMLKIDGNLISNMLSSGLDYQVVSSIYQLALIKKMRVVAAQVETDEIKQAVMKIGIDYWQGDVSGKVQPLTELLQRRNANY